MSTLTSTLKLQHLFLANLREEVTWISVGKPEAQRSLKMAKDSLLAHFKLEDAHLHPVLLEAAEKNVELAHTLVVLAKDMAGVSKMDGEPSVR